MNTDNHIEPRLIISSEQCDFELEALLGRAPSDFLVLCANGEQIPFLGTPYDSPSERRTMRYLCRTLNDPSGSDWATLFNNWKPQFCKHYKLAPETTPDQFRPKISYAVSRIVAGHSRYLHAAIQLFDELAPQLESWKVERDASGKAYCAIVTSKSAYVGGDDTPARAIVKVFTAMLKAEGRQAAQNSPSSPQR